LIGPGTLYNTLHRMLSSGLIEDSPHRPDPEDDDPRRRYYRITPSGRRALTADAVRLKRVLAAVREEDLLPSDGTG
jgi:DNA-binding PadR family transcriptional regulator